MTHDFRVFENAPRPQSHAGERIVGDADGQTRFFAQNLVEIGEQRAATRQHDSLVDDICGKFRRRGFERDLYCFNDLARRLRQRFADMPLGDGDLLGHAVQQIAALDLHGNARSVTGRRR